MLVGISVSSDCSLSICTLNGKIQNNLIGMKQQRKEYASDASTTKEYMSAGSMDKKCKSGGIDAREIETVRRNEKDKEQM